jgi:hypothetical protein
MIYKKGYNGKIKNDPTLPSPLRGRERSEY